MMNAMYHNQVLNGAGKQDLDRTWFWWFVVDRCQRHDALSKILSTLTVLYLIQCDGVLSTFVNARVFILDLEVFHCTWMTHGVRLRSSGNRATTKNVWFVESSATPTGDSGQRGCSTKFSFLPDLMNVQSLHIANGTEQYVNVACLHMRQKLKEMYTFLDCLFGAWQPERRTGGVCPIDKVFSRERTRPADAREAWSYAQD